MAGCPEKIISLMHDYLDGELDRHDEQELKRHLDSCEDCHQHYYELTKTAALIQSAPKVQAPPDFTDRTMARLPKGYARAGTKRWLRRHPFLASASLFLLLMSSMLLTSFNNDQQFSFTKQPNVIVEGETVIVPEGETVVGDLTVRNGDIRIEGEVQGDVTVINGSQYMASTGVITGTQEEIDQAFEWLWYTIKNGVQDTLSLFGGSGETVEE
ncbi:anti-sigma factor family protein [Indiicoccus explosivorum]|uniref:anti-sigma factor family protein n=1 Tax=Indiicoccus explosivorum TaxID=1917864 RepID=UPI000B432702|nr:anti-sigma factor [Indiicoccus explosivorum]